MVIEHQFIASASYFTFWYFYNYLFIFIVHIFLHLSVKHFGQHLLFVCSVHKMSSLDLIFN